MLHNGQSVQCVACERGQSGSHIWFLAWMYVGGPCNLPLGPPTAQCPENGLGAPVQGLQGPEKGLRALHAVRCHHPWQDLLPKGHGVHTCGNVPEKVIGGTKGPHKTCPTTTFRAKRTFVLQKNTRFLPLVVPTSTKCAPDPDHKSQSYRRTTKEKPVSGHVCCINLTGSEFGASRCVSPAGPGP